MSPSVIDRIRTDLVEGIGRYEQVRRRRRRSASVVGSVAVVLAVVVGGVTTWRSADDDGDSGSRVIVGAEPGPPPPFPGLETVPPPPELGDGMALTAEALRDLTPVWTGDELLVVGSYEASVDELIDVALAYDPAARTWRDLPPPPVSVGWGTAVTWTGEDLIVCCGTSARAATAAYDPSADEWRTLPNAPVRGPASAVWTGDRVVVVTGEGAASFDPGADEWSGLGQPPNVDPPTPPGPGDEIGFTWQRTVGNGQDVYAWPATSTRTVASGAVLDPDTGRWTLLPTPPESAWPAIPEIAWIGDALVVLGGLPAARAGDSERFVAARYDPASGRWTPLPEPLPEPEPCECNLGQHVSLWTGQDLLVFVSSLASGVSPDGVLLAYDPAEDAWRTVGDTASTALTPVARLGDQVLLGRGDGLFLSAPDWRPDGV